MSFRTSATGTPYRFRCVLSSFLQISGLAFAHVLAEEDIQRACDEEGVDFGQPKDEQQKIIYTPAVTLWAFLSQVLFKGEQRSCLAATARMVILLSLATAMVSGMALGPYQGKETGEPALLRELLAYFVAGDVLLCDRCYCSYFLIVMLQERGVDVVTRLHQMRTADFSRGRRLAKGDHVVRWPRPDKPDWMDEATYESMPESLEVRELHVQVDQPGFRTESLVVVTTLLDADTYSREDLAELYHQRWLAELDIRAIKIQLGMDVLRCQSPAMVRKEIWTCLLAYNLIRKTILESAKQSGLSPRQISFTAAMQKVAASWAAVLLLSEASLALLVEIDREYLARHRVGHRPNRAEPRKVKRRPKPHKLLTEPRDTARARLLAGQE